MTLTEVSYYTRKMIPFVILFILVLFIIFYLFRILALLTAAPKQQGNQLFTNTVFNKIKAPIIKDASTSGKFAFTLDTIEGRPLTASPSAKIYYIPRPPPRYGFREKAYLMAKTFGFNTDVVNYKLNDQDATFTDDTQNLTVNIASFNFHYEYDIKKDPQLFTNTQVPDEVAVQNTAIDFLKSVDRYPAELAQGKTKVTYFSYNPTTTALTVSETPLPDTNMLEVDFYRPDIEGVPSNLSTVSSKFPYSQNYVIMVFTPDKIKVVKAQVQFFDKSDQQVGIYPLKSGDVAWDQLQKGQAFVINGRPDAKNIVIKNMFLAYYDPDTYQEYLQPVYVFLGDNNFVGYVPAVDDSYLLK